MKKLYFATFNLPKPHAEHAKIVEVIREASAGDFKQTVVSGGVAFAFASEIKPWNLSFSKILHNTDSVMIFEIGEEFDIRGYGAIQGWLNARRPYK